MFLKICTAVELKFSQVYEVFLK